MKFKHRIQQQLTAFSVLLILLFGGIIIASFTAYTVRQNRDSQERSLYSSIMMLENILDDAEYMLTKSVSSLSSSALLSSYLDANDEEKHELRQAIKQLLSDLRINSRYIDAFCLYLPDSHEIITSYDNLQYWNVSDPSRIQWLRAPVFPSTNRSNWFIVSGIPNSVNDSASTYMMIMKAELFVGKKNTAEKIQLGVCLSQSIVRTFVFSYLNPPSGYIAMRDDEGHLFTSSSISLAEFNNLNAWLDTLPPAPQNDFGYAITFSGSLNMTSWKPSSLTGWTFYFITPLSSLVSVLPSILLPAFLAITPIFFLSQGFFRRLWKPIITLRDRLKAVEDGDLKAYAPADIKNEFGDLFLGYNKMLKRINELISALSDERAFHLDAEVRNLQSQINPHFLYNTLDTIQWMSNFGENQKAAAMTRLLANFYRISLNDGKPMISVERTVDMIESYFDIYRERNGNRYSMEIKAEKMLMQAQMLHNVVQPLVENALRHGLSNVVTGGELKVVIKSKGNGMMEIIVQDNGEGIEKERLLALRNAIANRTQQDGWAYALMNINQRLIMVYGPECALQIDSSPGWGTQVLMRMKL